MAKQAPAEEPQNETNLCKSLIDQLDLMRNEKLILEEELNALKNKLESVSHELEREVQRRRDLEQRFNDDAKRSTDQLQPLSPTVLSPIAPTSSVPTSSAPTSSIHYGQHAISQLPMTTRKKLSHLRAQIKRQASKAARSRLDKRSSVAGVTSSSGQVGSNAIGDHKGPFGTSLDANPGASRQIDDQIPTNSVSLDSPHLQLSSTSTSSPAGPGGLTSGAQSNTTDANSNSGPNQQLGENSNAVTSVSGSKHNTSHHNQHSSSIGVSVHQKNFKQKLIALIKKFRTDGSNFDSEEQYREALERELMKAAAGRGSKAIEELLEEEIDVEAESGSELEDWDNISETSTPKPSLRPFFSSTTLDKI